MDRVFYETGDNVNHPIVFADYHHSGLYRSFELLFEKRLGGTLFKPIGWDWWNQGYWHSPSQIAAGFHPPG